VILQRSLEIAQEDTVETLSARLMEECEWPLLSEAVSLYCAGRLFVRGRRVEIRPLPEE
jgi:phosphoribosylglycinamide formyltransferase-1